MRAIWATLRASRDLRLVLSAGLVSMTGDWVLRVGLAYYVYVLTGSTLASATMMLAAFVPQIVLSSVAGVFVDRWNRKRTMVASNLLLAAGLLPLLLVDRPERVYVIYVVILWEGCVQQFFAPAEQSLVPHLVTDQRLVTANALSGQTRDLSRLTGSALGGIAVAAGGLTLLTVVDTASFVIAAVLVVLVRTSGAATGAHTTHHRTERVRQRLHTLHTQWTSGLRLATRHRVLRVLLLFIMVTTVGEGVMSTLFAPYVREAIHGTSTQYGFVVSSQAVGGLVGGLVAASLGARLRAAHLLGWGATAFGAIDLVMFLYPLGYVAVWPATVCMLLVGIPGALLLAGAMTLFQRNTADSHRGRVFGALGAVEGAATVTGTIAAGFLGETLGIIPVLAAQGAGYLIAGVAVTVALRSVPDDPHAPNPQALPAATRTCTSMSDG